jgi:hypothetical protein
MSSQEKRITFRYLPEENLSERITSIAKREKRSLNQQIVYYLLKGLEHDELPKEKRIVIEKVKRELVKKMSE